MKKKKVDLYISIGNTRTSFACFENSISNITIIKRDTKIFFDKIDFNEILDELNISIMKIFICSVNELASKKLVSYLKNYEIVFLTANNQNIIDLHLIENKEEIGNDIIASCIYAQSIGTKVTIVSLGTATVISHLLDNVLNGCIIMPGLEHAYHSLIKNTDIPKIELNHVNKIIGRNTHDALSIGVIQGHKLMIQELAKRFHELDTLYIYFGGNTKYIQFEDWTKIDNLDLLGLYLFSKK